MRDERNGRVRYTYARIEHGRVKAMAMFVSVEQIDGTPFFQVGYAVPETYRGKGWAIEMLEQGLDELSNGLARHDEVLCGSGSGYVQHGIHWGCSTCPVEGTSLDYR